MNDTFDKKSHNKSEIDSILDGKPINVDPKGHRARVRAAMLRSDNLNTYSDCEMLEYLLFTTNAQKDTKPIAKRLLQPFGSLSSVFHAEYEELLRVKGVGEKTAHMLTFVEPIVHYAENSQPESLLNIGTPKRMAQYLAMRFYGQRKERILLTSISLQDEIIQTDVISNGKVDCANVDLMRIARIADRNGAKKIVMSHNHPGGTLEFSAEDFALTADVVLLCFLTNMTFIDHIIFCDNGYVSMFANNILEDVLNEVVKKHGQYSQYAANEKTRIANTVHSLRERDPTHGDEHTYRLLQMFEQLRALPPEEVQEALDRLNAIPPEKFE